MIDRAVSAATSRGCAPRAFAFAVLCLAAGHASAASPALSPWTSQGLERVADAAVATAIAESNDGGTQAASLVRVANALMHGGDTERAKAVLVQAGSLCGPPRTVMSTFARGEIVERLASLGDDANAEMLATVDADPLTRAALLGRLGKGRAAAGDISGAKAAGNAITAIAASTGPSPTMLAYAKAAALADIAVALNAAGAIDDALHIAENLPDGLPKVQILAGVARSLCSARPEDGSRAEHGGRVAQQAVASAKSASTDPNSTIARISEIELAAQALASCEGPAPARDLIGASLTPQQTWLAAGFVSDALGRDSDIDLARAMAPVPMPDDAAQLLNAAQRAGRLQNPELASALARRASQVAVGVTRDPGQPTPVWLDHVALLRSICDFLVDLRDYDDAITTMQPVELVNRKQFYVTLIAAEARHGGAAAIARDLPKAIEIVKAPTPGINQPLMYLSQLTLSLALAGYKEQAQLPYRELLAASRDPSMGRPPDPATLARLQAAIGDLPGALAAADNAGPLVAKPSAMQAVLPAIMAFDGARQRPTEAEMADVLERMKRAMPDRIPGPKANALHMIAVDLATAGDVDAAIHVEAGLEGEPRDVLRGPRDAALAAIAAAQVRAGNPEPSLSTALRIDQANVRLGPLLALANLPPRR